MKNDYNIIKYFDKRYLLYYYLLDLNKIDLFIHLVCYVATVEYNLATPFLPGVSEEASEG